MSEISTTGETRETKSLGEWLFTISNEGWEGEKVIAWADELPWDKQRVTENTEVHEVAAKFIQVNCYQPPVPGIGFA